MAGREHFAFDVSGPVSFERSPGHRPEDLLRTMDAVSQDGDIMRTARDAEEKARRKKGASSASGKHSMTDWTRNNVDLLCRYLVDCGASDGSGSSRKEVVNFYAPDSIGQSFLKSDSKKLFFEGEFFTTYEIRTFTDPIKEALEVIGRADHTNEFLVYFKFVPTDRWVLITGNKAFLASLRKSYKKVYLILLYITKASDIIHAEPEEYVDALFQISVETNGGFRNDSAGFNGDASKKFRERITTDSHAKYNKILQALQVLRKAL